MTIILPLLDVEPIQWQKSVRSAANGSCVEVGWHGDMIAVRDSKEPRTFALTYTQREWAAFLDGVKKGEFDHFVKAESNVSES
jgi:predicted secreted Zn-dependent protease